jgi:hypothetical protein
MWQSPRVVMLYCFSSKRNIPVKVKIRAWGGHLGTSSSLLGGPVLVPPAKNVSEGSVCNEYADAAKE